ncbi:MAG: MATE family efflux transporter [Lachnospiraceae bacterium]|nr:MATE family efflux transporter [Lachnospiraceae bacterium]MEE0686788.1 MATE family efflux transporter [Lachnospiraceae bacterium]
MLEKKKAKNYTMNLCEGSILNKLLLFALPLMASSMLQLLFNAADVVVVGRFVGKNSLAAVGSNGSIINLLTNAFIGLSVGANVLVARYFAANKEQKLRKTVHTAIAISIVSGIVMAVVGIVAARRLLIWMSSPKEVIDLAVIYLRIYFLGMPAVMLYNFGAAILRGVGDTKRPLYYLTFAGVVNVILNLIFVILLKMDVAGVALATIISQYISAALVLRCLAKETSAIRFEKQYLGIDRNILLKILKIGLPAGVQSSLFSFSNVIIQSSINSFGATVVAGNSAASNIEGFVFMAMNAFSQAIVAFVSQNVGAKKYERINKIVVTTWICVSIVGIVLGNGVYLLGKPLLGLYSGNGEVIDAGISRLAVICTTYALCGMMDCMVGALRGIGYSVMPMIVSLLGVCAFRMVWILGFFQIKQFHIIDTVYLAYPISWLLTFIVHVICYLIVRRKIDNLE